MYERCYMKNFILIGLWYSSSKVSSFLKTGNTSAIFNSSEKHPFWEDKLIMLVNSTRDMSILSFKILAGISPHCVALDSSELRISFLTLSFVTYWKVNSSRDLRFFFALKILDGNLDFSINLPNVLHLFETFEQRLTETFRDIDKVFIKRFRYLPFVSY